MKEVRTISEIFNTKYTIINSIKTTYRYKDCNVLMFKVLQAKSKLNISTTNCITQEKNINNK